MLLIILEGTYVSIYLIYLFSFNSARIKIWDILIRECVDTKIRILYVEQLGDTKTTCFAPSI